MASIKRPQEIDSPEVIEAIERAFHSVWSVLYAHLPPGGEIDKAVGMSLSHTLVALAAAGITDPEELRRRALEAMALTPDSGT